MLIVLKAKIVEGISSTFIKPTEWLSKTKQNILFMIDNIVMCVIHNSCAEFLGNFQELGEYNIIYAIQLTEYLFGKLCEL